MKICYACQTKSSKIDKITEETIIDKKAVNLFYKDAKYMSDKKIDSFIKNNLQYLNNDLKNYL